MEGPVSTVIWFGWAFACALGVSLGFTRLFRRRLGDMAQIAAYGMWLVLLVIGFAVVSLSGMQMYGFDASDPRQVAGYLIFFYSPLGLPTAIGAPAVFFLDVVLTVVGWARRRMAMWAKSSA